MTYEIGDSGLMIWAVVVMRGHYLPVFISWKVLDCQEAIYLVFFLYVVWWQWLGDRWRSGIISTAPILPTNTSLDSRQAVPRGFSRRTDLPRSLRVVRSSLPPLQMPADPLDALDRQLFPDVPLESTCPLKIFQKSAVPSRTFGCQLFPQDPSVTSSSLKTLQLSAFEM